LTLLALPPDWAKPDPGETKILAGDFFAAARKCGRIFSENRADFS